jgi:BirA family biotin operon repressor/biotin-[acetyl-CoA-carboxylase] ligase
MLSKKELQSGLNTKIFGRKMYVYDSIDSTNACAKVLASIGMQEGTVVISDYQTDGKGRQGRTWQSEPGSNLLISIIVRPSLNINTSHLLPFFAAAGVALAVEALTGIHCECKWPNDILINGKKCCGILMESTFQQDALDYAIIGIGLNVNQNIFPENLQRTATSLKLECKKEFERKTVFQEIMRKIELLYKNVSSGNFEITLKEWKTRATIFGKQIILTQNGESIRGRATALTADGGLLLSTEKEQKIYYTGDITLADSSEK